MSECAICIEKFNKSTRKLIKCKECHFEICLTCTKTVFKNSEKTSPCCANCNKAFDDDFIAENFPKSYINSELKKIQENVIFEEEKQLLPATQEFAKHDLYIQQLGKDVKEDEELYLRMRKQLYQLNTRIATRKRMITLWYHDFEIRNLDESKKASANATNNTWIKHCPCNDCTGYLSTKWKCDMCEIKVCKECHEPKDEDHECDPNNVATAQELMKTTKACPGCGTSIIKHYGCNQMWCTHCKTAFDWDTRKIVTSGIHNPHYYEWQRNNNTGGNARRELGDVVCGGIPDAHLLSAFINKLPAFPEEDMIKDKKEKDTILIFNRFITHVHYVEIRRLNTEITNNKDIRIKYLNRELTIDRFKNMCLTRKKRNRNKQYKQWIFLTLRDAGTDIIQNFMTKELTLSEANIQIKNLIIFINDAFETFSRKFSCSTSYIYKETKKKYRYQSTPITDYFIESRKY